MKRTAGSALGETSALLHQVLMPAREDTRRDLMPS